MTTQTIDMTPTWRSVLRLYVEVALNGDTLKGRQSAWVELERMADLADAYAASIKPAEKG